MHTQYTQERNREHREFQINILPHTVNELKKRQSYYSSSTQRWTLNRNEQNRYVTNATFCPTRINSNDNNNNNNDHLILENVGTNKIIEIRHIPDTSPLITFYACIALFHLLNWKKNYIFSHFHYADISV